MTRKFQHDDLAALDERMGELLAPYAADAALRRQRMQPPTDAEINMFWTYQRAVADGLPFSTWDIAVAEGLVR